MQKIVALLALCVYQFSMRVVGISADTPPLMTVVKKRQVKLTSDVSCRVMSQSIPHRMFYGENCVVRRRDQDGCLAFSFQTVSSLHSGYLAKQRNAMSPFPDEVFQSPRSVELSFAFLHVKCSSTTLSTVNKVCLIITHFLLLTHSSKSFSNISP